jgi:hypothetical protein
MHECKQLPSSSRNLAESNHQRSGRPAAGLHSCSHSCPIS